MNSLLHRRKHLWRKIALREQSHLRFITIMRPFKLRNYLRYRALVRTVLKCCVLVICISGCSSVKPVDWAVGVPKTYGIKSDSVNDGAMPWKVFYEDSSLVNLLSAAVTNSFDYRIAGQRARISSNTYAIARSNFLPVISATTSARVDRFGDYTMNGVGNHDTNRSESLPTDQKLPDPYPEYFAGVTFSWEANLWNKLSSRRKSAEARFLGSQEVVHGIISWLVGEVATEYYSLLGLDQERKVLLENLRLQKLAVELVKIQKIGGKANQLAVDQFESQFLNTSNRLFRVEQDILEVQARIKQLSGMYPGNVVRDSIPLYDSTLSVNFGSPRELISQRPDIRQSEWEVVATHADIISAKAAFYPSLQIAGNAGFSAFYLTKLFISPASTAYSLAAGLSAPIIQRKRIKALYDAANARQRIALMNYHKSILDAYHEVYVILNDSYTLEKQLILKKQEVQVLKRAIVNANDLFSVGFATYLEVITAQQKLLEGQTQLAELNKRLLQNRALLYRALGGGWRSQQG